MDFSKQNKRKINIFQREREREREREMEKWHVFLLFLLQYILGYCGHFIIFETSLWCKLQTIILQNLITLQKTLIE